ncbi:MAG: glycoside hydrolase family 73 [Pseudomonadales bacterium]|nr:glycoside hydrolase family 73 [Pseudomonadales bacterium]
MSRHLPLITTTIVCLAFVVTHLAISPLLLGPTPSAQHRTTPTLEVEPEDKPNFAAIKPVGKRKKAFFSFMDEYISVRNQEILALRARIENNEPDQEEWLKLAKRYRVKSEDPEQIRAQLLIKVDALPPSLVKAQAAIESAWGTSRFAVEGNNYFGQWCFRPGCGLVPESRSDDKDHEVRLFESPQASVNSYMLNLNSHRAYRQLRQARAEQRQRQQRLNGCYLAQGLHHYSEKGAHYVESLKKLIRVNGLERDPSGYCAPVMIAEEETDSSATTEQPKNPEEVAVDDSQGLVTPNPEPASPPSS